MGLFQLTHTTCIFQNVLVQIANPHITSSYGFKTSKKDSFSKFNSIENKLLCGIELWYVKMFYNTKSAAVNFASFCWVSTF